MDRIQIDCGIDASEPNEGEQIYLVSLNQDGAELTLWDGPSYGRALLEGQLCSAGFGLPLVNAAGGEPNG